MKTNRTVRRYIFHLMRVMLFRDVKPRQIKYQRKIETQKIRIRNGLEVQHTFLYVVHNQKNMTNTRISTNSLQTFSASDASQRYIQLRKKNCWQTRESLTYNCKSCICLVSGVYFDDMKTKLISLSNFRINSFRILLSLA